jgi:hypothetical protein
MNLSRVIILLFVRSCAIGRRVFRGQCGSARRLLPLWNFFISDPRAMTNDVRESIRIVGIY